MIYLFVWENYFRKKLINSWKRAFKEKYNELNVIHIQNVFDYDLWFFEQNLLSSGFFSERNLFIIDDFPFSSDEESNENISKLQEYFLNILPKIISENIIVFNNEKIDKRSKLYKKILEIWELKDFSIQDENDLVKKLQEVYASKVSMSAINKMIELKWINFSSISKEFDKILITKDFIDVKDLDLVSKDIEENIFEIISDLLNLETKKSILKLRDLANFLDNNYLLYNLFISNLRVYFYIFKLKLLWKTNLEIKEILNLWNRSFLVDKNYKIDKNNFLKIYEKIVSIDGKMKSWKLIWNDWEDFLYELEKCLVL